LFRLLKNGHCCQLGERFHRSLKDTTWGSNNSWSWVINVSVSKEIYRNLEGVKIDFKLPDVAKSGYNNLRRKMKWALKSSLIRIEKAIDTDRNKFKS
jgi:hypothetical protein